MSQPKTLQQYSGLAVNVLLALALLFAGSFMGHLSLNIFWLAPLMILETWAFTVKLRDAKFRFPTKEEDLNPLFVFLWMGHMVVSALLLMLCFEEFTDQVTMVLVPLVLREVAFLLMLYPSEVKGASKHVLLADLVLGLMCIMGMVFIWEGFIVGTNSTGSIFIDIPLVALLAFLLLLSTRLPFLYWEWHASQNTAEKLWWWGSISAVVISSVWAAIA